MNGSELKMRGQRLLTGAVPAYVQQAGLSAIADYKNSLAVVAKFVRLGTGAERATIAVLRIEGFTGAAGRGPACGEGSGSAARSATPPSNTGVNEGRSTGTPTNGPGWLLGSGL